MRGLHVAQDGTKQAGNIIGKMTNLKDVCIFIKDLLITLDSSRLRGILGTIKNIRVSGTFEIVVPEDQMHLWRAFIPSEFPARFVSAPVTAIVLPES
jgi:hypothetical protein